MSNGSADDCRAGRCHYNLELTDEEKDGVRWLMDTLKKIVHNKRPNADKAAAVLRMFKRLDEHRIFVVARIHEVESVLHAAGLREVDVSEIDRLTPGELN